MWRVWAQADREALGVSGQLWQATVLHLVLEVYAGVEDMMMEILMAVALAAITAGVVTLLAYVLRPKPVATPDPTELRQEPISTPNSFYAGEPSSWTRYTMLRCAVCGLSELVTMDDVDHLTRVHALTCRTPFERDVLHLLREMRDYLKHR